MLTLSLPGIISGIGSSEGFDFRNIITTVHVEMRKAMLIRILYVPYQPQHNVSLFNDLNISLFPSYS